MDVVRLWSTSLRKIVGRCTLDETKKLTRRDEKRRR